MTKIEKEKLIVSGDELIKAVKAGNFKNVKNLMEKQPELIGVADNEGKTALMWAAQNGYRDIVEKLVEDGREVGMQDNQGRNALAYTLSIGNIEHFTLKMRRDSKIYFDPELAISGFNLSHTQKCLTILFNKTNETDSKDINGITPLMRLSAAVVDAPFLRSRLNELNSNKLKTLKNDQAFTKDNNGKTAFDYAIEQEKVTGMNGKKVMKFIQDFFPQYEQALANQKKEKAEEAMKKAEKKRLEQETKRLKKAEKEANKLIKKNEKTYLKI